jgi:hypothetical protein
MAGVGVLVDTTLFYPDKMADQYTPVKLAMRDPERSNSDGTSAGQK